MSLTEFFAKLKRYDENAKIIFDDEEPIGRFTDLVMPRKRWFGQSASARRCGNELCHRDEKKILPPVEAAAGSKL